MRGEILGIERRRRWSDEDKLAVVSAVGVSGATVTQVTADSFSMTTSHCRKRRPRFVWTTASSPPTGCESSTAWCSSGPTPTACARFWAPPGTERENARSWCSTRARCSQRISTRRAFRRSTLARPSIDLLGGALRRSGSRRTTPSPTGASFGAKRTVCMKWPLLEACATRAITYWKSKPAERFDRHTSAKALSTSCGEHPLRPGLLSFEASRCCTMHE